MPGSANMRHVPKSEILEAMRDSLLALDNMKLLSPNDLEILSRRRDLRAKIADLEENQGPADGVEAKAMAAN